MEMVVSNKRHVEKPIIAHAHLLPTTISASMTACPESAFFTRVAIHVVFVYNYINSYSLLMDLFLTANTYVIHCWPSLTIANQSKSSA